MEWLIFALSFLCYIFACYITYHQDFQKHWSFLYLGTFIGGLISFFWYLSAYIMEDKHRIYFFSLCWDSMIVLIYYFVPIIFFGVKLDWRGWVGLGLMIAGVIVFKLGHEQ